MAQLQTHTPSGSTTPVTQEFGDVLLLSETLKRKLRGFMQNTHREKPNFSVQGADVYFLSSLFIAKGDRATLLKFQDRLAGKYESELTREGGSDFLVFQVTGTAKLGLEGTMKVAREALEGESIEDVDNGVAGAVARIMKN